MFSFPRYYVNKHLAVFQKIFVRNKDKIDIFKKHGTKGQFYIQIKGSFNMKLQYEASI